MASRTAKRPPSTKTLRVKQVRSGIGGQERHKQTLRSLGLRRMNQIVELPDNEAVRGMIFAVRHLVELL
ncbi:MAG: 50S ribosomal protein L30 [Acidobacteriota bacterium]